MRVRRVATPSGFFSLLYFLVLTLLDRGRTLVYCLLMDFCHSCHSCVDRHGVSVLTFYFFSSGLSLSAQWTDAFMIAAQWMDFYDLLHIKQPDTLLEIVCGFAFLDWGPQPGGCCRPIHTFPHWVIRTSAHVEEHHRSCLGGVLRGGCRPSLLHCSFLMHDCWWPLGSSLGQSVSSFVTGLIPALFTWCIGRE